MFTRALSLVFDRLDGEQILATALLTWRRSAEVGLFERRCDICDDSIPSLLLLCGRIHVLKVDAKLILDQFLPTNVC